MLPSDSLTPLIFMRGGLDCLSALGNSRVMRFMSERWNLVKYLPQSRVPWRISGLHFIARYAYFHIGSRGKSWTADRSPIQTGRTVVVQSDGAVPGRQHPRNSATEAEEQLCRSRSEVSVAADCHWTPLLGLNEPPHDSSAGWRDECWTLATMATHRKQTWSGMRLWRCVCERNLIWPVKNPSSDPTWLLNTDCLYLCSF